MYGLLRVAIVVVTALVAAQPARAGGEWLPPEDVDSISAPVEAPSVGTDSLGTVVAVWVRDHSVVSASRPARTGTWETPATLSGSGARSPRLAVTKAGTAIAVWVRAGLIEAAVRPPGGTWEAAETISPSL